MSIYVWQNPESCPDELAIRISRERLPEPTSLKRGVPSDSKVLYLGTAATRDQLTDRGALANDVGIPVVSTRVKDIVESAAGSAVQFIPAEVTTADDHVM